MSDTPIKRFRIGLISATIWQNGNGDKTFYNVKISRAYRDDNGDWQETNQYGAADLLNVAEVAKQAVGWISQQ